MNFKLYTQDIKMADIIRSDYKLLLILPRFGIDLGFKDQTAEEICQKNSISAKLFIMICNIYSFEDYIPCENDINDLDINQLITYLLNSHRYYMEVKIKEVESLSSIFISKCNDNHGKILHRFFNEYKNEVINHFSYEEDVVFPYISTIVKGAKSNDYKIGTFEKNHSDIDEKLNDLKNIIIKYLPSGPAESVKNDLLFNIFTLEEDLSRHALIENNVLIPLVRKIELNYGK